MWIDKKQKKRAMMTITLFGFRQSLDAGRFGKANCIVATSNYIQSARKYPYFIYHQALLPLMLILTIGYKWLRDEES